MQLTLRTCLRTTVKTSPATDRLLFGVRAAGPRKALPAPRSSAPSTSFHVPMKLFRDDAAGCCRSGVWRHALKTGVFLFLSVAVLVLSGGTAAATEGHVVESSQDTRHEFSGRFPLLPISCSAENSVLSPDKR